MGIGWESILDDDRITEPVFREADIVENGSEMPFLASYSPMVPMLKGSAKRNR